MDFDLKNAEEMLEKNRKNIEYISNSHLMQVSSSGADTVWTSLKNLYSKMIATAEKEVLIQSPYFVPDTSLISQLKIAALSGIKVKIMIAGVPD